MTHHVDGYNDVAFLAWRDALLRLTPDRESARSWRRSRYRFAHRLGDALAGHASAGAAVKGPVVYGVWLRWGLLYVGQTLEAERRLRDLPIGESHHLANTFPPEIWHKIVVVAWPELPEAQPLTGKFPPEDIGLALEYLLQNGLRPLVNSERRTPDGGWRDVVWSTSRSRGARTAHQVADLFAAVRQVWDQAAAQSEDGTGMQHCCRIVFPERFLPQS